MILDEAYFERPATELAKDLIGKTLCRRVGDEIYCREITETECYFGEEDTACHAHKGKTARTETLYRKGGVTYVYLCYGIHRLLNVVTGPAGHPEAVLIRGVEGVSGPGRVGAFLGLCAEDNGVALTPENGIWIEDLGKKPPNVKSFPRIGIGYASLRDIRRRWRFCAAPGSTEKPEERKKPRYIRKKS